MIEFGAKDIVSKCSAKIIEFNGLCNGVRYRFQQIMFFVTGCIRIQIIKKKENHPPNQTHDSLNESRTRAARSTIICVIVCLFRFASHFMSFSTGVLIIHCLCVLVFSFLFCLLFTLFVFSLIDFYFIYFLFIVQDSNSFKTL